MSPVAENSALTRNLFIELREYIFEKRRLYFKDAARVLFENRLRERLEALRMADFESYLRHLQGDPDGPEELSRLLDLVGASEPESARGLSQMDVLRSRILPALIEMKRAEGDNGLSIWSLAADNGQEAYTLGMVVREVLGKEISRWDVRVHAVCADPEKLEQARRARYKDPALRHTPDEYRTRHFRREKTSFVVKEDVRDIVRFALFDPENRSKWETPPEADVVFARDFLCRFGEERRMDLLQAIHASMRPAAFLFIAPNESLGDTGGLFTAVYCPNAVAYKALKQATDM